MKKVLFIILLVLIVLPLNAQSILGQWKTIDDETGEAKSIVEIFEKEGKVYGKIIKVLNTKIKNPVCSKCKGENKNKSIINLQIIADLSKNGDVYEDGTILNPSNGKIYKCRIKLEDNPDRLQVRGYIAFFYKTQYWHRVKK
ncbi:DUF2147 domain-containing protein [Winogradskyella immobilis]|uniref:DUF2147 domain-containing protein n=1 Tax=Winogradskyella immobilis TaxID=2816852 RepID=A0ABS8EPR7_9FLAO|nr:DUF2147 domain-containing protein [Winogradskyella immobilis]MCC1484837.1 DUF2147 domain-containing protein [Winogradskyella immobilis]MCG0016929.1 DUF2147 domain-containing protein [Winogradskyella immobilis]